MMACISSWSESGLGLALSTVSRDIQVSSNCVRLVHPTNDILQQHVTCQTIHLIGNHLKGSHPVCTGTVSREIQVSLNCVQLVHPPTSDILQHVICYC